MPYNVVVNTFVNLKEREMDTGEGWTVWPHGLLGHYDPDVIRFYATMIATLANFVQVLSLNSNFEALDIELINPFRFFGKISGEEVEEEIIRPTSAISGPIHT